MPPPRPYIPSVAVLRALSRPLPPQCPIAGPLPTRCFRSKHSKRNAPAAHKKQPLNPQDVPEEERLAAMGKKVRAFQDRLDTEPKFRKKAEERVAKSLDSGRLKVQYYEHYVDSGKPMQLVEDFSSGKQWLDKNREWREQAESKDEVEKMRHTYEELLRNPAFAHLADTLKEMKESLPTKEEVAQAEQEANSELAMAQHEWAQGLIDNPDFADAVDELRAFQAIIPTLENEDITPEAEETLNRLDAKLSQLPATARILAETAMAEKSMKAETGMNLEELLNPDLTEEQEDKLDDEVDEIQQAYEGQNINYLLKEMKEIMDVIGGTESKQIAQDLQEVIENDPTKNPQPEEDEEEGGLDLASLSKQIDDLVNEQSTPDPEQAARQAKAEALVDKILADPQLLIKLDKIRGEIASRQNNSGTDTPLTPLPSAPDPLELPKSKLTTYKSRLDEAMRDPEHRAALQRLRITLLPPFNVSPALKSLNEALRFAYLGASDDVRRILWRSYFKARSVPTLLQNMTDDAWDLVYYSQAVRWRSNQNRERHLEIVLGDLRSVGRVGPPTLPQDILAAQQE